MGLLKGQDEIMNDGDCMQILNTIFAKQLSECITYIENNKRLDEVRMPYNNIQLWARPSTLSTLMYCIDRAVTYAVYESTKVKLRDFVNHYELSYEDMNKLYCKYFDVYDPYTMKLNDSRIITVDYENTVAYLSKQYTINDVLGSLPLTLTEYQNWAYLVNAFRSYDIVFNEEFTQMQKEYLTNALNKFYGIRC